MRDNSEVQHIRQGSKPGKSWYIYQMNRWFTEMAQLGPIFPSGHLCCGDFGTRAPPGWQLQPCGVGGETHFHGG